MLGFVKAWVGNIKSKKLPFCVDYIFKYKITPSLFIIEWEEDINLLKSRFFSELTRITQISLSKIICNCFFPCISDRETSRIQTFGEGLTASPGRGKTMPNLCGGWVGKLGRWVVKKRRYNNIGTH